ncbi:MAG: hypothetical protein KatS3mg059_0464 [Thermomicrobiales bacterium]|nr:MAG: hypothetical protein KatS3mg059_0464 [Thermomicrobiales bacterium]
MGTFTDLVYLDEQTGELGLAKASSTPPNFAQGIMDAIAKSGLDPAAVEHFVHGTTVVINALTERKGAKTALVHHRRLSRCAGNRPRQPARYLQPEVPQAASIRPRASSVSRSPSG